MEAKELRIGNYVSTLKNNGKWENKQITKGAELDFIRENNYDFDIYKPIPLTEEWLLKFGYKVLLTENNSTLYRFDHTDVNIHPKGGYTFGSRGVPLVKVKYVHQLQNLYFALTGQELEINVEA